MRLQGILLCEMSINLVYGSDNLCASFILTVCKFLVVSLVWFLEKVAIVFSCFELTAIGGGDVMCMPQSHVVVPSSNP
jgi:hypothetical protein